MATTSVNTDKTGRVPPLALSVADFCTAHDISIGYFYELLRRGLGPRIMKVGTRTLVSIEEAAAWRAKRTIT
jgi:hypothetical protein